MEGHGPTSRAASSIRRPGRTISTLDGKKVVVIGSGATAATLIPNIADKCAHVTMLQRSPTYFRTRPQRHRDRRGAAAAAGQGGMDPRDRAPQDRVRAGCFHEALPRRARAGEEGADRPDQRGARPGLRRRDAFHADATGRGGSASPSCPMPICSRASRSGKASVVTDEIERFTENGILLKSGKMLERRHHRHRDRLQSLRARRHRFRDRRQAARLRRHRHLSRHDVHGRAEHGLGVRLFPRQLDAAHRSGGGFRLPAARRT